jgi:hypothetical protein
MNVITQTSAKIMEIAAIPQEGTDVTVALGLRGKNAHLTSTNVPIRNFARIMEFVIMSKEDIRAHVLKTGPAITVSKMSMNVTVLLLANIMELVKTQ